LKSPKAITLPSPSPGPTDPAGTSALPEKRGGEKGQSAVVGEANRARVMRKKRMERRCGGRKRLLRRERMRMARVHASSGRAELTMLLGAYQRRARCTWLSCSRSKIWIHRKFSQLLHHRPLPPSPLRQHPTRRAAYARAINTGTANPRLRDTLKRTTQQSECLYSTRSSTCSPPRETTTRPFSGCASDSPTLPRSFPRASHSP
jgi:hypothetical protein